MIRVILLSLLVLLPVFSNCMNRAGRKRKSSGEVFGCETYKKKYCGENYYIKRREIGRLRKPNCIISIKCPKCPVMCSCYDNHEHVKRLGELEDKYFDCVIGRYENHWDKRHRVTNKKVTNVETHSNIIQSKKKEIQSSDSEEPIILGTAIVDEKKIEIIEGVKYGFYCLKCDLIKATDGMYSLSDTNTYYKRHKISCFGNGLAGVIFCYPNNKIRFEFYCCVDEVVFYSMRNSNQLKRQIKKHMVNMHYISMDIDDIKVKEEIVINPKLITLGLITKNGHFTDKVTINK